MPGAGVTAEPAQLQHRRRGLWRQEERGRTEAELAEALLDGLAGGEGSSDGARAVAGAAQHLGVKRPLVQRGPGDALPTPAG